MSDEMVTFHRRKTGGHYARLMGTLHRHVKTEQAGDAALGMMTRVWSYCADNSRHVLSERDMAILMVRDKNGPRKLKQLLLAGFLERVEGGYAVHDWYDHNPGLKPSDEPANANGSGRGRESHVRDGESHATMKATANVTQNASRSPEQKPQLTPLVSDPGPKTQERLRETHTERARELSVDELPFAAQVQLRFRKLYAAAFNGLEPQMTGKNVEAFPERLSNTAKARDQPALAMLETAFHAWVAAGCPGRDKSTAYAAFITRFESLVAPPAKVRDVRKGFCDPSPPSAFNNPTDLDKVFGPEKPAAGGAHR